MRIERKNVYYVNESQLYQTNTRMSKDVNRLHNEHYLQFLSQFTLDSGEVIS